jgi:hypothetical protein
MRVKSCVFVKRYNGVSYLGFSMNNLTLQSKLFKRIETITAI